MRLRLYLYTFVFASMVTAKDVQNLPVQATTTRAAVPASIITPAPVLHDDVFKRAIATCGFIRGNSGTEMFNI
jgi:hypothetical protein